MRARVRRRRREGAIALIAGSILLGACVAVAVIEAAPAAVGRPPNVILIQTDDQTLQALYATWVTPDGRRARVMPKTLDLIGRHGISFERYYSPDPLCSPSRASLLSGRYAHNNGNLRNSGPQGGWEAFQSQIGTHNLAVWLQDAGYRTVHIGKFVNLYGGYHHDAAETEVPPGWDDWESFPDEDSTHLFYGYDLNVNGTIRGPFGDPVYSPASGQDDPSCPNPALPPGTCNYSNDILTRRAVGQINNFSSAGPLYLQLDYIAPHGDYRPPIGPEPAARHYDSADETPLPRPPGFNEADVSDKPSFLRGAARLSPAQINVVRVEYRKVIESLRSVDDGVGRVIAALRREHQLGNTYVFFISDNGYFSGEHRIERAKFLPYEPGVHLPLLVRGPGIGPGSTSRQFAANIDLAPTILHLAGAQADRSIDGQSLVPAWRHPSLHSRRPILLEAFSKEAGRRAEVHRPGGAGASISAPPENYYGVRLGPYAYVEYQTGDRELYDLSWDPYELHNEVRNPRYDRVQAFLRRQIVRLETCAGPGCRYTTGPLPEPARRR